MGTLKITFSRHAKRRTDLYNISEEAISAMVERRLRASDLEDGTHEVVEEAPAQHLYPLKVVFSLEGNELTIITAYPLKRGLEK